MRQPIRLAPILLLLSLGCATHVSQRQGVQAAVAVHAAIAAIDDAELALFHAGAIPADVHGRANAHILTALRAGKAFDASVRAWPADGTVTKLNLQDVTQALSALAGEIVLFGSPDAQARLQSVVMAAQQTVLTVLALLL